MLSYTLEGNIFWRGRHLEFDMNSFDNVCAYNSFWHYAQTCGFLIFFFFLKIEKLTPYPISSFPPMTVSTVMKIQCHSITQYQIKSNSISQYQIPIYSIRFWYYYIRFWYCDTIKISQYQILILWHNNKSRKSAWHGYFMYLPKNLPIEGVCCPMTFYSKISYVESY